MGTISSDLDRIRLIIGDTNATDPLLSDDEINVQIANWPNNNDLAAANCAEAIAAKWGREFNFSEDGQSFNRSERVNHYTELAATLRARGEMFSVPMLNTDGTVSFTLGTVSFT